MGIENQQIGHDTAPNKLTLSPRAKRRLQFIEYYYKIPTTAIRELIQDSNVISSARNNAKSSDRSLMHVNEIVNVEVCKYCSEIFTSKRLLQGHYRYRHTYLGKDNVLKPKSLKKRLKGKGVKRKVVPRKQEPFTKMLLNRNPMLNSLLDHSNYTKSFLFDTENFPNLNFVRELDKCVKNSPALDAKKNINITNETGNSHTEKEESYIDVEISGGVSPDDVDGKIVTIKIHEDCLSRSSQNIEKTISNHYKWLNLKDLCISVERCAIPKGFFESSQITTEKITANTELERAPKAVLESKEARSTGKATEKDKLREHMSTVKSRKTDTVNEEMNDSATAPTKKTGIIENMDMPVSDVAKKTTEDVNGKSELQRYEDYSKRKTEPAMMDDENRKDSHPTNKQNAEKIIKDQYKSLNLKELCVFIQRCDTPIEFDPDNDTVRCERRDSEVELVREKRGEILETSHIANKLKNIGQWKRDISRTLEILQQIKTEEKKDKSTNINFIAGVQNDSEPAILKHRECVEFENTLLDDDDAIIQTVQVKDNGILGRDQREGLNLRDFYVSLERCTLLEEFLREKIRKDNSQRDTTCSGGTHDTVRKNRGKGRQMEDTGVEDIIIADSFTKVQDIRIVMPKIDPLIRKKGHDIEKIPEPEISCPELENDYPIITSETCFAPDCMPELEKEIGNERDPPKHISEQPPKLEQVQNLSLLGKINILGTAASSISNNKSFLTKQERRKKTKAKPTNIDTTKKSVKLSKLQKKMQQRRWKVNKTWMAEELNYIINSLNSLRIKDDGDSYLVKELPIDGSKEKVFRNEKLGAESDKPMAEAEPISLVGAVPIVGLNTGCDQMRDKQTSILKTDEATLDQWKEILCGRIESEFNSKPVKTLDLNLPSHAKTTYEYKQTFGDSGMPQYDFQSVIKSRWSKITHGRSSIISEISSPNSSGVDLHNFACSIVKKTLDNECL